MSKNIFLTFLLIVVNLGTFKFYADRLYIVLYLNVFKSYLNCNVVNLSCDIKTLCYFYHFLLVQLYYGLSFYEVILKFSSEYLY